MRVALFPNRVRAFQLCPCMCVYVLVALRSFQRRAQLSYCSRAACRAHVCMRCAYRGLHSRVSRLDTVPSCILRHVGSDPEAESGRGEVILSPMRGRTLRPRVGGFYVSGRLWEVRFVVFYVSGRFQGAQFVVFYVSARLEEV